MGPRHENRLERTLQVYGGLNPALQRTRVLDGACAGSRRSTAAITTGRTWRSTRVPSDLYGLCEVVPLFRTVG